MEQDNIISYGDKNIAYSIKNRNKNGAQNSTKKGSKVLIKVHADGRVVAYAPQSANDMEINIAVNKRARWIWSQVETFRKQSESITPRQYISGESHFYLGKRYMLKVVVDPLVKPNVKLFRGHFQVSVKEKSKTKVKAALQSWYRAKAYAVFQARLEELLPQTHWVKECPEIYLKNMKKQWGSCSPKQRLILNPHLVKASKECIDYVLLHELCHIVEHNHSNQFYQLLRQIMPDWKRVKEKLDNNAEGYLNS